MNDSEARRDRSARTLVAGVAWVLLASQLACPRPTARTGAQASAARSVDDIIAHYYRAIGGYDRLERITTRHMWGTYSEGALHANTDITWKRPALRRVNVHAPGFDYAEGFNGETWEYNFQKRQLVIDTGAAAAAGRRGAEFDESFVDYARKRHTVEMLGAESFESRPVHRIRVTLEDGWQKEYVFDDSTGLIVALRKAMPLHATGPVIASLTSYEDWRAEGGVLQPHRFAEHEIATARLLNTLQWDSIAANVDLDASELARPAH